LVRRSSRPLLGIKRESDLALKLAIALGEIKRIAPLAGVAVPDSFDAATAWPHCAKIINDIRDQSNCGCARPSPTECHLRERPSR
jgi:cathepsin B